MWKVAWKIGQKADRCQSCEKKKSAISSFSKSAVSESCLKALETNLRTLCLKCVLQCISDN